jgi:hypothetical protein
MIDIRKIMNMLTTILVGGFLISFISFSYFEWYANIYDWIERVEVILYAIIGIDFIFNSKYYDTIAKRSIATIISQCLLYYYTELIYLETYYTIYGVLMLTWTASIISYKWKQ